MQRTVKKIQLYRKKGEPPQAVPAVHVMERGGLEGDRHCMDGSRQISITSEEILRWMEAHPGDGLCFRKFSANLILDSMEDLPIREGDVLAFGGGACCRITDMHKACFQEECQLFQAGRTCRLQGGILFAEGAQSGEIRMGDAVILSNDPSKT